MNERDMVLFHRRRPRGLESLAMGIGESRLYIIE